MTIPLWAAMFLAPLCSIIEPTFTLWIFGTTGSMKSTITAQALCHFGYFAYNTPPGSWTGTTNALEKKAFLVKDAPLWIDDYVPQSTFSGNAELKRKVDQLLRDWGNRAGRSRMSADLSLRQTFAPRGLIVSTAEQLPPGQSIQARLFQVEVRPGMITHGAGSPLTAAQAEARLYQHAMAGYLLWLGGCYEKLERTLPDLLLEKTEAARERGAHLRMPVNVAQLYLGLELGLQYAEHVGAIDAEKAAALCDIGWKVLVGLGEAQQVAAVEEKPVEMYLTAIQEMLAQGSVYLRQRAHSDMQSTEYPTTESRQANAEFIGWYGNDPGVDDNAAYADSRYWFLIPGVTFKAVAEFYRQSGVVFPDSTRGIKAKLMEQKRLIPGQNRRFDYQMSASAPRVLRIIKDVEGEAI